MSIGLQLGRPGIYPAPARPGFALTAVRLDVAGFVGVALRGPVDSPVLITSWTDFELRFGGFEAAVDGTDRLLPYAVQAFFAQGGERAYVVRVAPPCSWTTTTVEQATATYRLLTGRVATPELRAADEGTWGGHLSLRLEFRISSTFRTTRAGPTTFRLPPGTPLANQSLVRVRGPGLPTLGVFRWASRHEDPTRDAQHQEIDVDEALDQASTADVEVAVVTGVLRVTDTSSAMRREEHLTGLGLRPGHPRFVPGVLATESTLVRAAGDWSEVVLMPGPLLRAMSAERTGAGADRSSGIGYESFFDDGDAGDDPLDERPDHRGVDAIGRIAEIGILCVPDLTWRAGPPVPVPEPPAPTRAHWPRCCDGCRSRGDDEEQYAPPRRPSTMLDGRSRSDLDEIVRRQARVIQVAELRRRFVALLDVPAGLAVGGVTGWRAGLDSTYAAAYHPWLAVPGPGPATLQVAVPPSAFAAGIMAARERTRGLPWGPANELARGAVLSTEVITDAVHDQLHLLGINVFRSERDGFRLTAARTLSSLAEYRQLSVRRLMTTLSLTIERQTQWLVFEPSTPGLRSRLTHTLIQLLREMHRRGAFAGDTEAASFFVRCDDSVNPRDSQEQGRLIAEVGVAPAAPLEYLVLRISQDVDGAVTVAEGPAGVAASGPAGGAGGGR